MSQTRFIIGDTRDVVASLPDGSIDLVLTSPPFLALRSYLPADHPDKHREIGSEATPAEFLQVLLELTAEWRRVLAPHGSIAIELGDTYSGSGGAGGDYSTGGLREGQEAFDGAAKRRRKDNGHAVRDDAPRPPRNGRRSRAADEDAGILTPRGRPGPEGRDRMPGWPLDKSLCGIPHLYHLSLAYGINLLTGEPSPAGRWRVRNVIAWCRPNPPVGALGDKVRPATSYMTIATPSRTRYFDLDAIRLPPQSGEAGVDLGRGPGKTNGSFRGVTDGGGGRERVLSSHPAGAPPLDHWWFDDVFEQDAWLIPTQPYKGSHYATFPEALCDRPILSMVPPKVCLTCGKPSNRIAETTNAVGHAVGRRAWREDGTDGVGAGHVGDIIESVSSTPTAERVTLGWTDCGHDNWRRGIVLDPFGGSGTTGKVAVHHGRDAVLIDIDERNARLAEQRVGMFLSVEAYEPQCAAEEAQESILFPEPMATHALAADVAHARRAPARADDPTTSKRAAMNVAPRTGSSRMKVLALHAEHVDRGLTDDEMYLLLGDPRSSRSRTSRQELADLYDPPLLHHVQGDERLTRAGNPGRVWRLTETGWKVAEDLRT